MQFMRLPLLISNTRQYSPMTRRFGRSADYQSRRPPICQPPDAPALHLGAVEAERRAIGYRDEAAAGDVVGALMAEVGVVELGVATAAREQFVVRALLH